MRNTWIGIAMIALAALLLVGSRIVGPGNPPKPLPRVERTVEAGATEPGTARPATPSVGTAGPAARPPGEVPERERTSESAAPRAHPSNPTAVEIAATAIAGPAPPVKAVGEPGTVPGASPAPTAASAPKGPTPAAPGAPPYVGSSTPPAGAPPPSKDPGKAADPTASGSPDDPESDRRPPELNSLRFDPPEIKDGGTAVLTVGATDDLSGVKFIYGSVRSPSGAAAVPFTARDVSGAGVFSATIAIPAHGETGDWFVGNLQIVDKADNALSLVYARATVPEGGALRVVSEQSDSTAPTVHRVSLVKGSVAAGEHNQVVVEVDDDQSGVSAVSGAFQSPSKSAYVAFTCQPNGDGTAWTGDIPVPANADCGEWTLRQLRVVDKANNAAFLTMDSPQVGHVSFGVSGGGQCDSEAPTIDSFYFQPTVVSNAAATDVLVTVVARDDSSGVKSLSGWLDGPLAANGQPPRIYFECLPDPNNPNAPMTGHVTLPQLAAKGVWRVSLAQISDKANNTRAYNRDDPALRDAVLTVE
jgi:hypothetical protein